jgi:hypothetical protein
VFSLNPWFRDSGATYHEKNPYSRFYDYYLAGKEGLPPTLPEVSPGNASTQIDPDINLNCPWQSYDCTQKYRETQVGSSAFLLQHAPSAEQTYPFLKSFDIDHVQGPSRAQACRRCPLSSKECPPRDAVQLRQFERCYCELSEKDLPEAVVVDHQVGDGWIIHLAPGKVLSSSGSISRLLSFPQSRDELLLFTFSEDANATTLHGKKQFTLEDMPHLGIAYHSAHKSYSRWSQTSTECGKLATIESLARVTSMRWIPSSVVIAQQDPRPTSSDKLTIILHGDESLHEHALSVYKQDVYAALVAQVIKVKDVKKKLSKVKTDGVLLLDASITLDPVCAFISLAAS